MKKSIILIICALLILSLAGCKKTIKTDDGSISVDKNGNIEAKSNDGTTTKISSNDKGTVSLPDGYPKDILPVIDGAKIITAAKQDSDGKSSYTVMCDVNKKIEDIAKYYQGKLGDLTDKTETSGTEAYMLIGKKGGYEIAVYTTKDSEDKVILSLNLSPQK
jgi:hypothetical protein